ncbi:hypothetical protein RISK_001573 [Rhodopirellula islandica]|uniref:DUF1559 domain-containing protein n=1 Tax=Rhodopirellula islandica TaxID=595434 RepID=A0A0J1BII8_RHOIS|nr:hypothetical protein RISK_001573 [Rhodopirellula islandica]
MRQGRRNGFTLLELMVTLACVAVAISLLASAILAVRGSARKVTCANRLRQVGLAMLNYESVHRCYPRGNGNGFSFQVRLLPFLEETDRYDSIDMSIRPYDQLNSSWQLPPPVVYQCPSDSFHSTTEGRESINYVGISGGTPTPNYNGVIYSGSVRNGFAVTAASITDGLSNPLAITESLAYRSFPGEPNRFDGRTASTTRRYEIPEELDAFQEECFGSSESSGLASYGLGGVWYEASLGVSCLIAIFPKQPRNCKNGTSYNNALFAPSSVHGDLVHCVDAAGAVRVINQSIDTQLWQALGTRDGSEVIQADF